MRYLFSLLFFTFFSIISFAQNIGNSVVKISVIKQEYDYSQPWQKSKQSKSSGSGCIIEGNRILTCAHVVEFGEFIEIRKPKDSRKYTASIEYIAPEYDLAILRIEDSSFFRKTEPVTIGDLPMSGNKLTVYGFPTGGNDLSITSGIVSRIENIEYSYSNHLDLGIQIDAAINPGNSGGPVISDTTLIGLVFQVRNSGQNIGYMIPTTVIKSFLNDIADSVYDGPVPLLLQWQSLESPTLRRCYGVLDTISGVLINKVNYCSALRGYLRPDDILIEVDSLMIQNDGSTYLSNGIKTTFETIIKNKVTNDTVHLRLLRQGVDTGIFVPLRYTYFKHYLLPKVNLEPKYYIEGGFVFTTPSFNYFQNESYWQFYNPYLSYIYYSRIFADNEKEEIVMIASVLPHKSNIGYHDLSNRIVEKVNSKTIRNFSDLVNVFKEDTDIFIIEDNTGRKYAIEGRNKDATNEEVKSRFGIPNLLRY